MSSQKKIPGPKDIKAAAQAAAETAQSISGGAMRIPPATLQLAGQLPDLLENLAVATTRLNEAIDRAERYMALADPMIRTMDRLLPQLETLAATSDELYKTVSTLPGVSTIGRIAGGAASSTRKAAAKRPKPPPK
jgi:ABC-type transporter Mla subunit MlaD